MRYKVMRGGRLYILALRYNYVLTIRGLAFILISVSTGVSIVDYLLKVVVALIIIVSVLFMSIYRLRQGKRR